MKETAERRLCSQVPNHAVRLPHGTRNHGRKWDAGARARRSLLARFRFRRCECFFDDAADRFRAAGKIGLFAPPVVEAFQEFFVHANVDLWIL